MTAVSQPALKFLGEREIEQIHHTSFSILKKLGVRIDDPKLRNRLRDVGCTVQDDRVKFEPGLIQKMLKNLKREITLTSRTSKRVSVKPGEVLSHTTGGVPSIIDCRTGLKRKATLNDVIQTTQLMNQLDQLDLPCALLYPYDVPDRISQVRQCEHLLRYSQKPVYGPGISSPGEAKYIVELFKAFAGGERVLAKNPIGVLGVSPESPLYYPQNISDTMELIISAGIPTVMLVAPMAGLSAPLTIAGGIAQLNAEMLAFATIAYVINPETPLIYGARMAFANMKKGYSIWGLPDVGIASAMAVQMAGYYGFLSDVYGLSSTSCTFDNQAGYEKGINGVLPLLAGANLLSGFGSLASLTVASYEQLVIDNETFAALRKIHQGAGVNQDTLAFEVVASVVNGGNYLEQEHTVRHLRSGEVFIPNLGFAGLWNEWETSGQKDIRSIARECVQQLIDQDNLEPLSPELEKEVSKIINAAYEELVR